METATQSLPERKYAYRRVAPGLILLLGNDGQTRYVVGRYMDGPTWGLEDEPRDFTAWGWGRVDEQLAARLLRVDREDAVSALRERVLDNTWPRHQTMRAAIEDALTSAAVGGS